MQQEDNSKLMEDGGKNNETIDAIEAQLLDNDNDSAQQHLHKHQDSLVLREDVQRQSLDIQANEVPAVQPEGEATVPPAAPAKHERQQWGSRLSFILASIGAAIGFGNFFRFPYLTYSNGGGAFLIPWVLALLVMGMPMLLTELALGQIVRRSSIKAMQALNRRTGGVGFAAVAFGGFGICTYYCVLLAWIWVYLFYTFRNPLPWAEDTEKFFKEYILQQSSGLLDIRGISWGCVIGLLLTWIIIYFCVFRGVKSTGFVSYITVPLPYILVTILLIRAVMLDGAASGIYYYLKPDFSLLLSPKIWLNAAGQIFFTLGISSGVMTAYGSFNKKNQDMVVDNAIVCLTNCSFSFYSGYDFIASLMVSFAVFSILGHMAKIRGISIGDVTTSGLGLGFVAYPAAVSLLPLSHLFALLLFVTMFTLGLDSAFALVEATNAVLHDFFPKIPLWALSIITCVVGFILGLPYCFHNGIYLIDIVDHFFSDYCLVGIAIAECIVIGYFAATDELIPKFKAVLEDNKFKRVFTYIRIFIDHSVDPFRRKIASSSRLGLTPMYNIALKFVIPVILFFLAAYSFVQEFLHPYNSASDIVGLLVGVVIVALCFGSMLFCCIFPIGAPKAGEFVLHLDDDDTEKKDETTQEMPDLLQQQEEQQPQAAQQQQEEQQVTPTNAV